MNVCTKLLCWASGIIILFTVLSVDLAITTKLITSNYGVAGL